MNQKVDFKTRKNNCAWLKKHQICIASKATCEENDCFTKFVDEFLTEEKQWNQR